MKKYIGVLFLFTAISFGVFQLTEARRARAKADNFEAQLGVLNKKRSVSKIEADTPSALPTSFKESIPAQAAQKTDLSFGTDSISVPGGGQLTFRPSSADGATIKERNRDSLEKTYEPVSKQIGLNSEQYGKLIQLELNAIDAGQETFKRLIAASPPADAAGMQIIAQTAAEKTRNDLNQNLRDAFGESAANSITDYELTLPARSLTNRLSAALAKTDSPLSQAQSEQLVTAIVSNGYDEKGRFDLTASADTILKASSRFLSKDQLAALQRIQGGGARLRQK